MKVTSVKTSYTNCNVPAAETDKNYIGEFSKTITPEEKQAVLYADWSTVRVGEMLEAFINQYVAWCPEESELQMDAGLQLAHALARIVGRGNLQVDFEFAGTRENIRTDKFNFVLQAYAAEDLVPETEVVSKEPTVRSEAVVEEGEPYEHAPKYSTYFGQHEALGKAFKSLAPLMTKENQLNYIQLVTFLAIEAEVMCHNGAAELGLTLSGLSYADEKDEAKIKYLAETAISITGNKEAIYFDNYMAPVSDVLN